MFSEDSESCQEMSLSIYQLNQMIAQNQISLSKSIIFNRIINFLYKNILF
jgi:hypothetical protein